MARNCTKLCSPPARDKRVSVPNVVQFRAESTHRHRGERRDAERLPEKARTTSAKKESGNCPMPDKKLDE